MNKVFISGRLTKEPEHKVTQSGISVTRFTVATTRKANRDQSDFHNIVAWRGLADTCAKYLVKGQGITLTGELQYRQYEDKEGVKRTITEINAEDIEFGAKPNGSSATRTTKPAAVEEFDQELEEVMVNDDKLPF